MHSSSTIRESFKSNLAKQFNKLESDGQAQSVLARLVCQTAKRAAAVNGAKRSS